MKFANEQSHDNGTTTWFWRPGPETVISDMMTGRKHAPDRRHPHDGHSPRYLYWLPLNPHVNQLRPADFCSVGGGPTGVEMAGAIGDLAHTAFAADFRILIRAWRAYTFDRRLSSHSPPRPPKDSTTLRCCAGTAWGRSMVASMSNADASNIVAGERILSDTVIWLLGYGGLRPGNGWVRRWTDAGLNHKMHLTAVSQSSRSVSAIGDTGKQ